MEAGKGGSSLEDAEERLCVICLVNERNTTVLPCRHMCMCNECAQVDSATPLLSLPTQSASVKQSLHLGQNEGWSDVKCMEIWCSRTVNKF